MTNIHPTAIVDAKACIADDVTIGPFCTVGPNVHVGSGCKLISHVVLDGCTEIGERIRFIRLRRSERWRSINAAMRRMPS